ncbi:MAG: sulfatase-like hydrolase/transferase [Gammaproteobacteria bacterium]
MHTRTSLLRGMGWFVLVNALLFKLVTSWFWNGVIEPAADATAGAYRLLNGIVHWPLLALLMVGLPLALAVALAPRRAMPWGPWTVAALAGGVATCLMIADAVVFAQYRMHLGPYVWGLVAGGSGEETFLVYSGTLPWLLAGAALAIVAAQGALFALCLRLGEGWRAAARPLWLAWAVLFTGSNVWYAWADATYRANITQESGNFPFYRPLTAKRLLIRLGVTDLAAAGQRPALPSLNNRELAYPSQPLQCSAERPPNVLLVVVDAWRSDHLDPQFTPQIARLVPESLRFEHHVSGGNVTRFGIFSIFYGLSGNYWWPVLGHQTPPVLMTELRRQGYELKVLGSAPLVSPEFDRTIFSGIAGLRLKTPGDLPADRDRRVTADMVEFLYDPARAARPFFGFLWLNSVHSYNFPADYPLPFEPSWEEVNHLALGPWFDKRPYLNRYRNALHFVDSEVGKVIDALDRSGLADDTLLIVTSDHGEEFNDTGKNYWGHNGNFSPYQVHVPLLVRGRGWARGGAVRYMTTHNDIAPTILTDALGCTTPASAYSLGLPLRETAWRRDFVAVVDYDDTGVYEPDRVTLFSPFGGFPVYSHDYDRLDQPPRMDRVRAVTEDMLRFRRAPGGSSRPELSP